MYLDTHTDTPTPTPHTPPPTPSHSHPHTHTPLPTPSHSLLDSKINSALALCHDQVILSSVHSIIENMIACGEASQQQLSYLQS